MEETEPSGSKQEQTVVVHVNQTMAKGPLSGCLSLIVLFIIIAAIVGSCSHHGGSSPAPAPTSVLCFSQGGTDFNC